MVTGLGEIAAGDARIAGIDRWLAAYTRRQPGCRALVDQLSGVGAVTAPTLLAELGDARRFRNPDAVVRYTGLDITVYSSDGKRSPGRLSRQGPQVWRWALFEAAKTTSHTTAPDHDYYHRVRDRLTGNPATLSVARKLIRRTRHLLAGLGDDALAPVDPAGLPPLQPALAQAACTVMSMPALAHQAPDLPRPAPAMPPPPRTRVDVPDRPSGRARRGSPDQSSSQPRRRGREHPDKAGRPARITMTHPHRAEASAMT